MEYHQKKLLEVTMKANMKSCNVATIFVAVLDQAQHSVFFVVGWYGWYCNEPSTPTPHHDP